MRPKCSLRYLRFVAIFAQDRLELIADCFKISTFADEEIESKWKYTNKRHQP